MTNKEQETLNRMLLEALEEGKSVEEIKEIIARGANVNARDNERRTTLMYAKTTEQMKFLIDAGVAVNAKDRNSRTALDYVKTKEQENLLLVSGAARWISPERQAYFNEELFKYIASEEGRFAPELIETYVRSGADPNAENMYGFTPLMNVRTLGQAKMLIKLGADVNMQNRYGRTALMEAYDERFAAMLLKEGARVDVKDKDGITALMRSGTVRRMELLIEAGADVNAVDNDGCTVLMWAKTAEQTKLLIEAGADVNAVDNKGRTALNYARTAEQRNLLEDAMKKKEEKEVLREHIEERKANIKKSRQLRKCLEKQNPTEKNSGVALADENIISGKERRRIMPDVVMAIGREKVVEK